MKKARIILLVFASLAAISTKAQIVTNTVTGRVSQIYLQPNGTPTTSSVFSVGTPFSLSFSYDLAAQPSYYFQDPVTSLSYANYDTGSLLLSYNGRAYAVSSSVVSYQILNNSSAGDYFRIKSVGGVLSFPSVDGYFPHPSGQSFSLQLQDSSGLIFSSAELPSMLSLNAFDGGLHGDSNYVALRYGDGDILNIAFKIDSLSAVPVPESSAYGLGGVVLGIALILVKRRKK